MLVVMIMAFGLVSCGGPSESAPAPDSDSQQEFEDGNEVPIDKTVYIIQGTVQSPVESLVRQTEAAGGSMSGWQAGGFGSISGSYFGPEFGGKGFIRVLVEESNSHLAPVGTVAILKSSDTKASILGHGDRVTFKCRAQYEAVAAVLDNEKFDREALQTWELDYCRMVNPNVELPAPE